MQELERLCDLVSRLRSTENGCDWDRKQTWRSLAPYAIEEAYEFVGAIESDDPLRIRDELGDLLLQLVYHARIAEEQKLFDLNDIAHTAAEKLSRRHPTLSGGDEKSGSWEATKDTERAQNPGDSSQMACVEPALPGLTRAVKLQSRAARVGFDWEEIEPVFSKIQEELQELQAEITKGSPRARLEDELGDIFFACANLARHLKLDPEQSVRGTNAKFERRFRAMENMAAAESATLQQLDIQQLETLWQCSKRGESNTEHD